MRASCTSSCGVTALSSCRPPLPQFSHILVRSPPIATRYVLMIGIIVRVPFIIYLTCWTWMRTKQLDLRGFIRGAVGFVMIIRCWRRSILPCLLSSYISVNTTIFCTIHFFKRFLHLLVTISITFVNRHHSIWIKGPQNNLLWICSVVLM